MNISVDAVAEPEWIWLGGVAAVEPLRLSHLGDRGVLPLGQQSLVSTSLGQCLHRGRIRACRDRGAGGRRARPLSHEMLTHDGWNGAPPGKVLECILAPYEGSPRRIAVDGLPVHLASVVVVKLGHAFHELAADAAKYGAFSVPEGVVEVGWTLPGAGSGFWGPCGANMAGRR